MNILIQILCKNQLLHGVMYQTNMESGTKIHLKYICLLDTNTYATIYIYIPIILNHLTEALNLIAFCWQLFC